MSLWKSLVAVAAMVAVTGAAQAALVDRGGGMIYDTTRNITWLADMNYAATSGYAATNAGGSGSTQIQASGRMGWDAAMAWASNLVYGSYDDWRLPTLNPSDTSCSDNIDPGGGFPLQYLGLNCTGGDLLGRIARLIQHRLKGLVAQVGDEEAAQFAASAIEAKVL